MDTTAGAVERGGQHRLMGMLAIGGGVLYIASAFVLLATDNDSDALAGSMSVFWALGAIAGLVGIGMIGAAGRGLLGRIALAIAVLAYAIAALDGILFSAGVYEPEDSVLFAISRLGSLIGMLLLGFATVAARVWPGWRRFAPFAVPLALPVAIVASVIFDSGVMPLFIGLAWLVIGYAVVSTPTGEDTPIR
jgi:hypothetical protein